MDTVIVDSVGEATLESINSLEQRYMRRFPAPYRDFLLVNNGGRPEPDCFTIFNNMGQPINQSDVHSFFGIRTGHNYDDLEFTLEILDHRLDYSLLPIGDDSAGNLICIETGGEHRIMFWDHEGEHLGDNIFFIASSLGAFLEGLYKFSRP